MNELRYLWYLICLDCVPCMLAYIYGTVELSDIHTFLKTKLEWIDYTVRPRKKEAHKSS